MAVRKLNPKDYENNPAWQRAAEAILARYDWLLYDSEMDLMVDPRDIAKTAVDAYFGAVDE